MKYSVIILAAGSGSRTGLKQNKILYEVHGKSILEYSVGFFQNHQKIGQIILVVSHDDIEEMKHRFSSEVDHIILGGKTRQESVKNSIDVVSNDFVLIHDAARPYISFPSISRLIRALEKHDSVTLVVPVKDTIQKVNGNRIIKALNRSDLVMIQTPQAFRTKIIKEAHKKAVEVGFIGTDDTMIVHEMLGIEAIHVMGDYRNIKLTTLEDIPFLEVVL